ncbi:hypothetical protein [Paenibacillus terrae]|uniref:hypothetical protein n=1 Tax=Paenibacillus terrae TaxID=159743 RepID=UPI00148510BD|nr:hypothetical protein [Paenibacillus terrae]
MKIIIKEELSKEANIWWYKFHKGKIFEVERDEDQPRKYFRRVDQPGLAIRCCDAKVVK